MNAFDDQHAVICCSQLAADRGSQFAVLGVDFAHIQCAAKCAYESTTDRGHKVVNGRGMRFDNLGRFDTIVGRNRSMNTERNTMRLARKVRVTQRTLPSLYLHFCNISYFGHSGLLFVRCPDTPESYKPA